MSRARGVLVVTALLLSGSAARAQEIDIVRLQDRVTILQEAFRNAAERALQYDSLMRQPADWVKVDAGPYQLRAQPEYADMVRRAARVAVDSLRLTVGSAAAHIPPLSGVVNVRDRLRQPSRPQPSILNLYAPRAPEARRHYTLSITPDPEPQDARPRWYSNGSNELGSRDDIEGEVTFRLLAMTYDRLDGVPDWVMLFWTDQKPVRPIPEMFEFRNVYREVVASPYAVAQRCFAGDNAACRLAFGLRDAADTWREVYTEEDLRTLVTQVPVPRRAAQPIQADYEACLTGDLARCSRFVETQYEGRSVREPFSRPVRASLLQVAFTLGGDDALRRLVTASGSVQERLEITAGVPLDDLFEAWRSTLREVAGEPVTTSPRTAVLALVWTLVFAYLGLRSTQWR